MTGLVFVVKEAKETKVLIDADMFRVSSENERDISTSLARVKS
jgi:hypothetical protein